MGWASGTGLAEDIINNVTKSKKFTDDQVELLCKILIDNFENFDCDTLDEVNNRIFKKVYQQLRGAEQ